MLLNKQPFHNQIERVDTKFPLLISSGQRQNYTLGSGDEGVLAFRAMDDVNFMVGHLVGDDGWMKKGRNDVDSLMMCGDTDNTVGGKKGKRKKKHQMQVISAAERVLAKASDRAFGVVVTRSSSNQGKKCKRGWDARSCVVGTKRIGVNAWKEEGKWRLTMTTVLHRMNWM